MDTAQIKAYAPQARKDFINAVTQRAARFGIHGDDNFDPVEFKGDTAIIGSQVFTKKGGELRERLVAKVKKAGFEMFIRSSAYTWFNRFVAIRYMELHDFLDHGFRVLSNPNGSDIPEILEHATEVDLPGLDREKVLELRLAGDKDNELYRMFVIAQCNALHKAMPFLFDRIDNEAELLLPDNLLHTNSPVKRMVSQIDEVLWDDVKIIGWIYQFYISEKKDEVIGKVVKSEDIPAATQLFTPNWIVKYMVENTLGRMWMATYPESSLKSKMEYYIEPAEQEPNVQAEIDATTPKELNPEELTFLDPACGSGHILVEAYDILKEIYLERGYRTRDIPRLILSKNIYGLDIDDRAAQLACFAVLMRAREDDRRLFSRDDLVLNIMSIVETKGIDKNKLLDAVSKRDGGKGIWVWINQLVELFESAKTFGSLIIIPKELADELNDIKSVIESNQFGNNDIFSYIAGTELQNLKPVVRQAQLLAKKYNCVVANPPYMGSKGMNPALKDFAKVHFPTSKSDLFAIFIERNLDFSVLRGLVGMITMQSWMFLTTYEKFRKNILDTKNINSMLHIGSRGFDSISGEIVSTTSFVLSNSFNRNFRGSYVRLVDGNSEKNKKVIFNNTINGSNPELYFKFSSSNFKKIPGYPIAYWVSETFLKTFNNSKVEEFTIGEGKNITANNDKFLRFVWEVDHGKIGKYKKWINYAKGGPYRKWAGNLEHICDWSEETRLYYRKNSSSRIIDELFWYKEGITWTVIASSGTGFRYLPCDTTFDTKGLSIFLKDESKIYTFLGLLNSKVANIIFSMINPTLCINSIDVKAIPAPIQGQKYGRIVEQLVDLFTHDWDSYETSWKFSSLHLLKSAHYQSKIKKTYKRLTTHWEQMIITATTLEEKNNQFFIELFGLQKELSKDVSPSEVTLTCNPVYRYGKEKTKKEYELLLRQDTIKELISYAIGCMMGRYSKDVPSLIYAYSNNESFDKSKYKSFPVDDDGIIPIMDTDWFKDDATKRFTEFIKTAWPEEYLDENLKFVADSLTPKTNESPEDTIRRYLSTTFFKDHMKMYKKCPIYWLFSSGKQKAFECLVYLHRYNESTLSRMRSNYVTPLQGNISARIEFLDHEKDAATTPSAQKKIQKQIDVLKKKQVELKSFDDELRHYADMKISLDLDDGVKVNYGKFGNLLAQKKAITGKP